MTPPYHPQHPRYPIIALENAVSAGGNTGGFYGDAINKIFKINVSSEGNATEHSSTLTRVQRQSCGLSADTAGFSMAGSGGYGGGTTTSHLNDGDSITWSSGAVAHLSGSMNQNCYRSGAVCQSETDGYMVGGYSDQSTKTDDVQKYVFSSGTSSTTNIGTLSDVTTMTDGGGGNNETHGYVFNGNANTGFSHTTVGRFAFSSYSHSTGYATGITTAHMGTNPGYKVGYGHSSTHMYYFNYKVLKFSHASGGAVSQLTGSLGNLTAANLQACGVASASKLYTFLGKDSTRDAYDTVTLASDTFSASVGTVASGQDYNEGNGRSSQLVN